MKLTFNLTKYGGVMAFYAVLTYILFPAIAYFFFRKDIGVCWQRFHRRKCCVGGSVADGWNGDGEGGVSRLYDL